MAMARALSSIKDNAFKGAIIRNSNAEFVTEDTPKALANFSPGLERQRQPWDQPQKNSTLKGFAKGGTPSGFRAISRFSSQGCRWRSNPGLKLANAFGVMQLRIIIGLGLVRMLDSEDIDAETPCCMERKIQIFKSFAEAKEADKQYYHSLTPAQRIQILLILRDRYRPYGDKRTETFVKVCRIVKRSE